MNVKPSIWDYLSRVVLLLLFVAGITGVFFWYLPLIKQSQRFHARILALEADIQRQERINRQFKAIIDAVQRDPRTVERTAREILGYAKPNEVVVKFEGPKDRLTAAP